MASESYKRQLERMTLSELLNELESEQEALSNMLKEGGGYIGYSDHLQATRENISYIKELISRKS